jgi:hypothetical protein
MPGVAKKPRNSVKCRKKQKVKGKIGSSLKLVKRREVFRAFFDLPGIGLKDKISIVRF